VNNRHPLYAATIVIIGFALIFAGLWLIWPPAALIAAGVGCLAVDTDWFGPTRRKG
jgi:hypothetical protein